MFACGHQGAIPWAEPDLGLPAAGLARGGELCQASLAMTPAVGRRAVGPGTCAQGPPGMGIAGLGTAPLLTPPPTGRCRGREPKLMHALWGVLDARQVAQCGHRRHRHRALDTAHGLEGLDDRREAPGVPLLVECEFSTAPTFRLCRDGLDVCLQDHVLRRGGTAHRTAPAQVGRTPIGPPGVADSVPQHEGCAPELGRFASPEGLFPRSAQSAHGFIVDGGDIHRGEVP
jgi:hypothetical protein